ncbi:hypothetical protein [Luteolibacter sp. Populi]|uniref:hypothetical protein n=1 Tax=Luteolibacter sp. Populi TaxID=3230487 RepID=UPI003466D519
MNTYWIKYVAVGLGVGLGARVIQDREELRDPVKEAVIPAALEIAAEPEANETKATPPRAPQGLRMTHRTSAVTPQ